MNFLGLSVHGEYLEEGVYLDSGKYAKNRIGVLSYKLFRLLARLGLNDNEAADLIGQWAGKYDAAAAVPTLYLLYMRTAMDLSFDLAVRSIEPEDKNFIVMLPGMVSQELLNTAAMLGSESRIRKVESDGGFFERMPILIPQTYFVPPPNLSFTEFPAKIDDATIKEEGKVAQAHVDVFNHHA